MKTDKAIIVKNVNKYFKIYKDRTRSLKKKFINLGRKDKNQHKMVLNNIGFEINKGESVAIVGKNGSGKSTILKLLVGILAPNSGSINVNGKVCSLIELGAGFHPDMTGRENIYINASIFGVGRKEVDEKLDRIIQFSELEEDIDEPVRTYSSGMYMRLAFSIAINVEADVLLIDEILAVGDAAFQNKCINKLLELKQKGVTIVFVSHSDDQVMKICERSIWINNGTIMIDGDSTEVLHRYLESAKE